MPAGAAADGIVTSTALMRDKGAGEITALIGPTIRQPSYQVGADMREACLALWHPPSTPPPHALSTMRMAASASTFPRW